MDVFSAWTRQPDDVVYVEPVEEIVLRLDAKTDELVGYTVVDRHRRFARTAPDEVTLPLVPEPALPPRRAQVRLFQGLLRKAA